MSKRRKSRGPRLGGIARAARLPAERRREIASLAARTRWARARLAAEDSGYPRSESSRHWEDAMAKCERENPAPPTAKPGDALLI